MGKIFGIGLSRTGTTSLNKALGILGYKAFHFPPLIRILELMQDYDAATDTPIAASYPMLDKLFPDSKFILTVRDAVAWRRSVRSSLSVYPPGDWSYFLHQALIGTPDLAPVHLDLVHLYLAHNANARVYFSKRPEQFLEIDITADPRGAWEALSFFLGKEIPEEAFPHENASA